MVASLERAGITGSQKGDKCSFHKVPLRSSAPMAMARSCSPACRVTSCCEHGGGDTPAGPVPLVPAWDAHAEGTSPFLLKSRGASCILLPWAGYGAHWSLALHQLNSLTHSPKNPSSAGGGVGAGWERALVRASGGLKEGAALCSWGGGERRKECGGRGRKSSGRRKKELDFALSVAVSSSVSSVTRCVYTLSKLEWLRHEYVFPSAYFAPGMVISGGGGADSCRV